MFWALALLRVFRRGGSNVHVHVHCRFCGFRRCLTAYSVLFIFLSLPLGQTCFVIF